MLSKNKQISNFLKIRPVGVEFFFLMWTDGQSDTDMTKLIIVFRNFADTPTNHSVKAVQVNKGCLF